MAGDLDEGDFLLAKDGLIYPVIETWHIPEETTVYNLEITDNNTYFAGLLALLVHNVCLKELAERGVKWAQNMIRGITFNKTVNEEMFKLLKEEGRDGLKYEAEVWLKDEAGNLVKRIDGLIPGKAIIERKATDLAKVTEETAKSYIRQAADHQGLEIANASRNEGSKFFKGTEENILQVTSKEGISDAVKQYAIDNKVTIVETSEEIFKAIGF